MNRRNYRRRGATVVAVTVCLFVLLGFTAFAVDLTYMMNTHAEVQRAADSGALSGATAFGISPDEMRTRAGNFTRMNESAQIDTEVLDGNIQLGHWEHATLTFTELPVAEEDEADAIRVIGSRVGVPYYLAPVMNIHEYNVDKEAIAHVVPPCGGVWGISSAAITGNAITDSYNSADGPYDPDTASAHGDVCSNGPIEVIGSAEINGDAGPGPGYEVDEIGAAIVTGSMTPSTTTMDFPPVDFGDSATVNDNGSIGLTDNGRDPYRGGELDLYISSGHDNLTLYPGTYYFTSMTMNSQATLTIRGPEPTIIYVTGDIWTGGGGIINETQDPHNLTIYSTGTVVELYGNSGFYATVYAPESEVRLRGTSDYYGEFVGGFMDIGGTANIHVDESLDLYTLPAGDPILVR